MKDDVWESVYGEVAHDDFCGNFLKSLLDLLFWLSMTSMRNTEDTQRPACTLISTPGGSLASGGHLSSVIVWDTRVNCSANNLKKVKSIFHTVLISQKRSSYS